MDAEFQKCRDTRRQLIHCVSKNGHPFIFAITLCVVRRSKNIWQYCSSGNLQQNTHFKFYIDAWYLIVTQAKKTRQARPS